MTYSIALRLLLGPMVCGLFVLWCVSAQAAPLRDPTVPRGPANCSWDRPGHLPFIGDVVAAVDHYPQIPADVRARLKVRMAQRSYDDIVTIRRDSIAGSERYDSSIRGMHFGNNRMCGNVTRSRWTPAMEERGLVYCDSGTCVMVPTVCRNVSLITRQPSPAAAPAHGPVATTPEGELILDPPGAGPLAAPAAPADLAGGNAGQLSFNSASTPGGAAVGGLPGGSSGGGAPGIFTPYLPGGGVVVPTLVVPELGTWALMGAGLAAIACLQRRRRTGHSAGSGDGASEPPSNGPR